MSRLRTSIVANLAGGGWSALMQLACVPFYIRFLGIEGYGLIGFSLLLQGCAQALDLGLGAAMTRELARASVRPERAADMRDLLRTLLTCSWMQGLLLGALVYAAAPWIAHSWLKPGALSADETAAALRMMALLVVLQAPSGLTQGGLQGLQQQVALNGVRAALSTVAGVGAVLMLWLFTRSLRAFFLWQALVLFLQVALLTLLLWRRLPAADRSGRFDLSVLRSLRGFAAGMIGINLSSLVVTHLDKAILSRLLSLEIFGYYALAATLGSGLYVFIMPVFNALFPRFTTLVAASAEDELRRLYHRGTQFMAVLLLPLGATLAFFPEEVLLAWTGDPETSRQAAPLLRLLVAGTALHGLMHLPHALQLAYGWTRIGLSLSVGFAILFPPALFHFTMRRGAAGAALAWLLLNAASMLIGVFWTHRRLLKTEAARWYLGDLMPPLAAAALVAGLARLWIPPTDSRGLAWAAIAPVCAVAYVAAAGAAPEIRRAFLARFPR